MVENTQQAAAAVKQLGIKTGVVNRIVKDHVSYKKEKTQLEEKIEKLKSENAEEG